MPILKRLLLIFIFWLFFSFCCSAQTSIELFPLKNQWQASLPTRIPEGWSSAIFHKRYSDLPGSNLNRVQASLGSPHWSLGLEWTEQGDAIYSFNAYQLCSGISTDWGKWGVALTYTEHRFDGHSHYPQLTSTLSWLWSKGSYALESVVQWPSDSASPSMGILGIQYRYQNLSPFLRVTLSSAAPFHSWEIGVLTHGMGIPLRLSWSPSGRWTRIKWSIATGRFIWTMGFVYSPNIHWITYWGGGWHEGN